MKKAAIFFACCCWMLLAQAQGVAEKLEKAFQQFENDSQLRGAIASLYVIDAKTGTIVFDKNSGIGLAPASTQKIITAATAYELLGKDFRYATQLGYDSSIDNGVLKGHLFIIGSGDPTLGSWRWAATKVEVVMNRMMNAIRKLKVHAINNLVVDNTNWEYETIPDGWIWQDIGNYYGAGATKFNWRENQYDIVLQSGKKVGDPVNIAGTNPPLSIPLRSALTTAPRGSGDNAYVYYPLLSDSGVIRGTIPANESNFKISAAIPQPDQVFMQVLQDSLERNKIDCSSHSIAGRNNHADTYPPAAITVFHTEYSPTLDAIIYWFLKKSINLCGEALVKTIAHQQKGVGSTDTGVTVVQKFWKQKGLDETELNIVDGSGLSPLNRVTTHAQVAVLQYAKTQSWYKGFYDALPEYNGMKMKSGTIHGVKGFAGYHTAKNGTSYIFSFLVNNYNGASSSLVQKMYNVLNNLK